MPTFRTDVSRPFEVTGVDYAGPLYYKISKEEQGKCYVLIFTCAASRAIHLELTRSQSAEEFQRKLNAFITRRTRLLFEDLETVILEIKRNLNNRPLPYTGSDGEEVLTPNTIMWGVDVQPLEDGDDDDEDEVTKMSISD